MIYNKILFLAFILLSLDFSFSQCLGDTNQDEQFDVADVIIILDYIIEEEAINQDFLIIADLNFDQNIDIFDIIKVVTLIINESECYTGITETDLSGNIIGNIDEDDWCEFEFNNNATQTGLALNPPYPNPANLGNWGPFGSSYQICYQYSTPYDSTWNNLSTININIVSSTNESIYTYNDNYANGQIGICAYIADSLVINSIYRMVMTSDNFECHGDIQFNH